MDGTTGREWKAADLRRKSWDDLHRLWYVLLLERNRLQSEKLEYRKLRQAFPDPSRLAKVRKSMNRIKQVMSERLKEHDDPIVRTHLKNFINAIWDAKEGWKIKGWRERERERARLRGFGWIVCLLLFVTSTGSQGPSVVKDDVYSDRAQVLLLHFVLFRFSVSFPIELEFADRKNRSMRQQNRRMTKAKREGRAKDASPFPLRATQLIIYPVSCWQ